MAILGMNLAWITVSDLQKAETFFEKAVGLKLEVSDNEHGWLEFSAGTSGMRLGVARAQEGGCCGGESPEKGEECKNTGAGSNAVVTITVDNIITTKKDLEGRGVTFTTPIMELPGHVKLASFVDPDRNQFQLVEILSKK